MSGQTGQEFRQKMRPALIAAREEHRVARLIEWGQWCPICQRGVERIHKHLHVAHGWASPGEVFGRIVMGINGSFVCEGCGFKVTKKAKGLEGDGPITVEYLPRCGVCGVTFTNRGN